MTYNNEHIFNRFIGFLQTIRDNGPHDAKYATDAIRDAITGIDTNLPARMVRAVEIAREMQATAKCIEKYATDCRREMKAESYSIKLIRRFEAHESLTTVVHADSKEEAEKEARDYADRSKPEEWEREETNRDGVQIEGATRIPK